MLGATRQKCMVLSCRYRFQSSPSFYAGCNRPCLNSLCEADLKVQKRELLCLSYIMTKIVPDEFLTFRFTKHLSIHRDLPCFFTIALCSRTVIYTATHVLYVPLS